MKTIRSVIEDIFTHPPVNDAELKQRLGSIDDEMARRQLTERLEKSLVQADDFALFIEVFSFLGIGKQRNKLREIAANKKLDTLVRTVAITVLADHDPDYLDKHLSEIDPEDFARLADRPLIEMITSIEANPDTADGITEFLLESPEEMREFLLFRLGQCRKEAGVSAATVYAHALRCEALAPLHEAMITAIIEEGNPDGIALVEELRTAASNPQARKVLQSAMMRMGTRAIDPKKRAQSPAGTAFLGSCDGLGTFVVVGCFKKPNGSSTTANLCIRASLDIRDGFVIPRHNERELEEAMARLREGSGCEFVEIPLEQAAAIVTSAEERTHALKLSLPEESRSAIKLFGQFRKVEEEIVPNAPPGKPSSLSQIRQLLKKPIYRSWFFDIGDLKGAGVQPPPENKSLRHWLSTAATKLDKPDIRNRVVAMAEHMKRWHGYNGEKALAALCESAAQDTRDNFAKSALVRVMLENSAKMIDEESEVEHPSFGTPELRQELKSRFFKDVKSPKGKDMALLDFTEIALSCLDSALTLVPGDRRPRDDEKPMIAYTIGKSFWQFIVDKTDMSFDRHTRSLSKAITRICRLEKEECYDMAMAVSTDLVSFVNEVCTLCPASCAEKPRSNAADLFFSPYHPLDYYFGEFSDDDLPFDDDEPF
jgi:hypothetical protein